MSKNRKTVSLFFCCLKLKFSKKYCLKEKFLFDFAKKMNFVAKIYFSSGILRNFVSESHFIQKNFNKTFFFCCNLIAKSIFFVVRKLEFILFEKKKYSEKFRKACRIHSFKCVIHSHDSFFLK